MMTTGELDRVIANLQAKYAGLRDRLDRITARFRELLRELQPHRPFVSDGYLQVTGNADMDWDVDDGGLRRLVARCQRCWERLIRLSAKVRRVKARLEAAEDSRAGLTRHAVEARLA